jgi:hypothetical protein
MNKKLLFALVFMLVGALLVVSSIALAKCDLARLEIINKTNQPVSMALTYDVKGQPALFYYLTVPANATKLFTVERHVYARTTWSCDKVDSGTVDIMTQLRLTFTMCTCGNDAPNSGEPGLEKVHIPDAPDGKYFRYK